MTLTPATHVLSNNPSFLSVTKDRAVRPMDIPNVKLEKWIYYVIMDRWFMAPYLIIIPGAT